MTGSAVVEFGKYGPVPWLIGGVVGSTVPVGFLAYVGGSEGTRDELLLYAMVVAGVVVAPGGCCWTSAVRFGSLLPPSGFVPRSNECLGG
jgi:hypothetical protein